MRRLEACQSPVWDTVLAMTALADAGLAARRPVADPRRPVGARRGDPRPGDWPVRRPDTGPGRLGVRVRQRQLPRHRRHRRGGAGAAPGGRRRARPAIDRGHGLADRDASKDGGWGAFDADNTRKLVNKLPFCDFGAVIDPPSADVTAHVVEAFAAEGRAAEPAARRGVVWLLRAQEPDGSWFGRWGANYVYGTGAVVPALIAAGVKPSKPAIRRAVAWLERHQNPDGGWGEDLRSYDDPALAGREPRPRRRPRGRCWPCSRRGSGRTRRSSEASAGWRETQRPDGTWDEPWFTGTGFPGDFYINYHLYRLVFPVSALGRYVHGGHE